LITKTHKVSLKTSFNYIFIVFFAMNLIVGQQYFGGELRTKDSFLYGRFEARLKSAQGDGLVSSFFTYQDELINGGHIWNEIDIEVLGRWSNIVNMNTITPGQSSHLRESLIKDLNAHSDFNDYAFEWTPNYVAWFINGKEYYRQDLPTHTYIATLRHPQKIMMNLWVPVYEDWVGKWNEDIIPRFAYYDNVSYYEHTPGTGSHGTGNNFTLKWNDEFDSFDSSRWEKATHTFSGNRVKFEPGNVVFKDGKMILCLTYGNAFGYQDSIKPKALYGYKTNDIVTIRFSEELDSLSAINNQNYRINNVQISQIRLDEDLRTISLATTGITSDKNHRISLSGINDLFGNTIENQILVIVNSNPVNLPFKVNVGGENSNGFLKDKFWWYDYEDYGHLNGNHQIINNIDIKNTSLDKVYSSSAERIAVYRVRIDPGVYDITLMFSDNHYNPNERSFDVIVEGSLKITDLDVSREVGKNSALEKKITYVPVTDGVLDIHFDLNLYGQGYAAAGPFLNGLIVEQTSGLGVKNDEGSPSTFKLGEAFPNPFNNNITIPIKTNIDQSLTVDIVDALGKQVDILIRNKAIKSELSLQWDAKNFSTGTYFIRAITDEQIQIKKVSLVK
tara:strand:- start:3924 stop:5774 length:1851 start_codon:yes stop_codon:yes gene_type:complete